MYIVSVEKGSTYAILLLAVFLKIFWFDLIYYFPIPSSYNISSKLILNSIDQQSGISNAV